MASCSTEDVVFLLNASCSPGDVEQDTVERNSSMDVLWMIDNSGSMYPFQAQIRKNFISFLENFNSKNFDDFQIGVTVTDGFLDFNFDTFATWSNINSSFSANNLPCKDGQKSDCYDYETDTEKRFISKTNSALQHTNCDVCYSDLNDKSTLGAGREISVLSNLVLDELRQVCEIVNNDNDTTNNCEDVNAPGVKISGDEKFLDLFNQIIASVGVYGSGYESPMQSIQAARLNPRNKDFFRDDTHLAVIIVSDEDDMSVNHGDTLRQFYPVSFYKDLLELTTNKRLGVTVHNIGYAAKGESCIGSDQSIYSKRNTELAESLNGVVASLCGDFAKSLKDISTKIIEATSEFLLGGCNVPSQDIVKYYLNEGLVFVSVRNVGEDLFKSIARDKTRTNGWDYNADNNSILFFGNAVPENKAKISIVFDQETLK